MPVPRQSGHAVDSCRATALRMNSLLLGIASSNAASSGSTLNATICLLGRGFRGKAFTAPVLAINNAWAGQVEPWLAFVFAGPRPSGADAAPRARRGAAVKTDAREDRVTAIGEVATRARTRITRLGA